MALLLEAGPVASHDYSNACLTPLLSEEEDSVVEELCTPLLSKEEDRVDKELCGAFYSLSIISLTGFRAVSSENNMHGCLWKSVALTGTILKVLAF